MAIKVKTTGSAEYGHWIKVLLCGDPGKGKTRFARSWPNPLYLNCEGGLMSVAADQLPYIDITSTDELAAVINILKQEPDVRRLALGGKPVDTVVVDTFDEIQRLLIKERLLKEKKEALTMPDWGWLGDQCRSILRALRNLDMNVIFTCHIKTVQEEETGKVTIKPQLQGSVGDEVPASVDLALLLDSRPMQKLVGDKSVRTLTRYAQTYPDSNHPWIKDRSGKLPMEFEITFEDDYQRMHGLIYGGIPQVASEELVVQEVEAYLADVPAETPTPARPAPPAVARQQQRRQAKPETPKVEESGNSGDGLVSSEVVAGSIPASAVALLEPGEAVQTSLEVPSLVPEPSAPLVPPSPPVETVSGGETPDDRCDRCGTPIANPKQAEQSKKRYKETLCRTCLFTCQACGGTISKIEDVDRSYIQYRKFLDADCFKQYRP